ncbi:MAG: hypothetical protein CSA62_08925 [Planctomycetota bacterium]|nr:MAG: hypothetical protein CSA62_08925 [Planctomycetota bacterium]
MSGLLSRFVGRPVLAFMIAASILVLGLIANSRIPITLLPDGIARNRINVFIRISNLTPQEAEEEVYEPFENQLLTIAGVTKATGRCSSHSIVVTVETSPKVDVKYAAAEVRDRLHRARAFWPAHIDRWGMWRETNETLPLMFIAMGIPSNEQHCYDLLEHEIQPALERVEGVGEITMWGMIIDSIRILFDRDRIQQFGLNFREILQELQKDNRNIPIGEVREGEREFVVRAELRYPDLEAIRSLPVAGGRLQIRDIARVERRRSLRDRVTRVDGKIAVSGMIRKTADANSVETAHRVREYFEKMKEDPRFAGFEPIYNFDKGEMIEDSLSTLKESSLIGAALAFFVLWFFLRRLGVTAIITLSLPLSLLVAMSFLYFRGRTLNLLSMASLTMALGMLVDNSVVVLENIFRLRQTGRSWMQACIEGVRGVGTAVALATLTTIAVFLPIGFFGENASATAMSQAVSLPLCIALLASLFVALVLMPASIAFVHRRKDSTLSKAELPRPGLVAWMTEQLTRFLDRALRHRFLSCSGLLLAALLLSVYIKSSWQMDIVSTGGGRASIEFEFPRGTLLSEANRVSNKLESFLMDKKQDPDWPVEKVSARFDRKKGSITVSMPRRSTSKDLDRLVERMRQQLPTFPGIEQKVWGRGEQGGDGGGGQEGKNAFTVTLKGRDSEFLRDWALALEKRLLEQKLAKNVEVGSAADQEELRLGINRQRMQELGVDPWVFLSFVNSGLSGQRVSRFREPGGFDTDLIAEFDEVETMELKQLLEMQIWSRNSGFQRLGDLSEYEFTKGYEEITRSNGVLTTILSGERPEGLTMSQFEQGLRSIVREQEPPRGFSWEMGGRFGDQWEQQVELVTALVLGMVLVFLVMGLLFESVTLPLAVFGTVPFAMGGGLAGLFLLGHYFELVVILGLMILGGVIVNNGIVLLDHVVRLRAAGLNRHEAILQGVRDRLRPIIMTATTTIVGLAPMIFIRSEAQAGFDYKNMAIVVASGLMLGTFLTPFVVSLGYTLVDDGWLWVRRVLWQASRSARPSGADKKAALIAVPIVGSNPASDAE